MGRASASRAWWGWARLKFGWRKTSSFSGKGSLRIKKERPTVDSIKRSVNKGIDKPRGRGLREQRIQVGGDRRTQQEDEEKEEANWKEGRGGAIERGALDRGSSS